LHVRDSGRASARARRSPRTLASALALLALLLLAACTSSTSNAPPAVSLAQAQAYFDSALPQPDGSLAAGRPNIVFVLTDDLSTNLVQYMPHVQALMKRGMSFTNYTVSNSLCCPSRASIFTGEYPHNSGVLSNRAPRGGYVAFREHGDSRHTFAVSLHSAGYRTAFAGKYLNGYSPDIHGGDAGPRVPPGWSSWGGVGDGGYAEYNYGIALGQHLRSFAGEPQDYMTTVLDTLGQHYIRNASTHSAPFMLELATFAPHAPYVAAPEDVGRYADLSIPHTPAWNKLPTNAPAWLANHTPLTPNEIAWCNAAYRKRVASVQAVDRMLGHLQTALRQTGQLRNTVFVFSSDNGYHTGEYALTPGKLTAFDTDVNVPLVVAGPGIAPGSTNADLVQNVDLAPTFDELAGAPVPADVDGRSIVPLLHGQDVPWRSVGLIEHLQEGTGPNDPDRQSAAAGSLPSYVALRTSTWTYVQYVDGEREFYERLADPFMLHNIYPQLSSRRVAQLEARVAALSNCAEASCWQAGLPSPTFG
jgi:N-acetylglucosamine-6-sulfatase